MEGSPTKHRALPTHATRNMAEVMATVAAAKRMIPNLYTSFASAFAVLDRARPKTGSQLDAYFARLDALSNAIKANPDHLTCPSGFEKGFFFAVVEGLDGSGKSSALTRLSDRLGGQTACYATRTPPTSLAEIRPQFDAAEEGLQRAFYASSNDLAAQEIIADRPPETRFVLCDRYYHSTVSWTAASFLNDKEVKELAIPFPVDLLMPDIVLFLDVAQEERLKRTGTRPGAENIHFEEKLAESSMAERVRTAFGKVWGPKYVVIDGNRSREAIAASMYEAVLEVSKATG